MVRGKAKELSTVNGKATLFNVAVSESGETIDVR
jgi:hypothetical protein